MRRTRPGYTVVRSGPAIVKGGDRRGDAPRFRTEIAEIDFCVHNSALSRSDSGRFLDDFGNFAACLSSSFAIFR
jgi:hypothetical protein